MTVRAVIDTMPKNRRVTLTTAIRIGTRLGKAAIRMEISKARTVHAATRKNGKCKKKTN